MSTLDPRALRTAFGTFMTGVTVVTTHDEMGAPVGFTANSFTSVSLEPPLVLVCLAKTSRSYDTFAQTTGFAINILSEGQIDVSNTFARPVEDRFAEVSWQKGPQGAPVLAGVSAWFDCEMHQTVDAGDHIILIGKVAAFDTSTAPGLGYAAGAYVTPSAAVEAMEPGANLTVSALIEHNGDVLLMTDDAGQKSLPHRRVNHTGVSATLTALIASTGIQARPGFVYSVYDEVGAGRHHLVFLCVSGSGVAPQGSFYTLTHEVLERVADPAVATLLKRFEAESRIGAFGLYYGDQISGEVRHISQGS